MEDRDECTKPWVVSPLKKQAKLSLRLTRAFKWFKYLRYLFHHHTNEFYFEETDIRKYKTEVEKESKLCCKIFCYLGSRGRRGVGGRSKNVFSTLNSDGGDAQNCRTKGLTRSGEGVTPVCLSLFMLVSVYLLCCLSVYWCLWCFHVCMFNCTPIFPSSCLYRFISYLSIFFLSSCLSVSICLWFFRVHLFQCPSLVLTTFVCVQSFSITSCLSVNICFYF